MACTLEILQPVKGFTNSAGDLIAIVLTGKANNCDLVDIIINCGGPKQLAEAQVHDGLWSVIVPLMHESGCRCDANIRIEVRCRGGDCRDVFEGQLQCEPASQCPNAYSDVDPIDAGRDCVGGKRVVTGQVIIAPDPAKPVGANVKIDGVLVGSHGVSATVFSVPFTATLTPGKHLLTWDFSDPSCNGAGQTITVPACEGCPSIEVKTTEGECREGKRSVTVVASIPDQGVPVDAAIVHAGKKLAQNMQSGAFTLTGTDEFSGGTNTVTIEISQPPGCQPTSHTFTVKPCERRITNGPGGGGDDDDDGSGGCIIGRIAVVLLFATAIFFTLMGICLPTPANTPFLIAAGVAWVAAGIAMAIWALLCGSRCGTYLISWQSALFGAWLAAYMVTCCPFAIGALIALAGSAILFFGLWVGRCRPSACRVFVELLWVTAVPVATILTGLQYVLPCGLLSGIVALNSVVTAGLTVAAAAACAKK
jgi:hypothetical protein